MIKIEELTNKDYLPIVYEVSHHFEGDYVGIDVYMACKKDTIKGGGLDGLPILRGQHVKTYSPSGYFITSKTKDKNGLTQIGGHFKGDEEFLFTDLKDALKKYNDVVEETIQKHLKQISLNNKERIKLLTKVLIEENS